MKSVMSKHAIDILVNDTSWEAALPGYEALLSRAVGTTLTHLNASKTYELSIVLTGDAEIQELNREWRGKDKPTNVLSFPQDEDTLLGDIILALGTIESEARSQDKTLADHTTHLTVHGLLHLLGYDHEVDAEAEEMEALEIAICAQLGVKNPYAGDDKAAKIMA